MNPYIITVASGKGGVGKTALSVNLAQTFSNNMQKVLLIDADIMFPNAHLMLGCDPKFRIDDWLYNDIEVVRAIEYITPNLGLLAGTLHSNNLNLLQNFSMLDLIASVISQSDFDFILIDTSAGITNPLLEAASIADKCAIIVTDEPTSIIDGYGLIKILKDYTDKRKLNAIINNVIDSEDAEDVVNKLNMATNHFLGISVDILGITHYEKKMKQSILEQKILCNYGLDLPIITEFDNIVKKMIEIRAKS